MVPIRGEWTPFIDIEDQLNHYRLWGLIPPKSKALRPIMVVDGYFDAPEPCQVVGYQGDDWAVIELSDGYHGIYGEYLAELQPNAQQKVPSGTCFAEILSRYIVLDIETTGFDFKHDRIIEIAACSYSYGKRDAEFHTYVNPEMIIPKDIVSLTGITQDMITSAPSILEVAPAFLSFIEKIPLIGHNLRSFDVPFLSTQLSYDIDNPIIDTLPLARSNFELLPCHKLEYLNDALHLGSSLSHRAFCDVETTNALLWACLSPRKYEQYYHKAFLDHRVSQPATTSAPKAVQTSPRKQAPKNIRKFQKIDVHSITPSADRPSSDGPLTGKMIVFTGELSISREDAMQMAVDAGATLKSSVSRKTDYLVVGKQDITLVGMDGMSSKEERAHELNQSGKAHIEIITEERFIALTKGEAITV